MNLWSVEHFLTIFVITFGWVCCCFAVAPTQKWWQKWPRNIQLIRGSFGKEIPLIKSIILGLYRTSRSEVWKPEFFSKSGLEMPQLCQFWTSQHSKSFWASLCLLGSLEFAVVLFLFPVCSGYPDDKYYYIVLPYKSFQWKSVSRKNQTLLKSQMPMPISLLMNLSVSTYLDGWLSSWVLFSQFLIT